MRGQFKLDLACKMMGYTRQAYYKAHADKQLFYPANIRMILPSVERARKSNPTKGCRAIYEQEGQHWPIGRDRSIDLLMDLGYRVRYPKQYKRATQAGNREFGNLLVNKIVTGINQVWQSDMAYYLYGDKHYYTLYITDVYSQEIVGYGAYSSNMAVSYAQVLQRAISSQKRFTNGLNFLIHHSDGGKQYESRLYKSLCSRHGIIQSMCMYPYENPYAEKTNDLINNGYLNVWRPKSLVGLRKHQHMAVKDHNTKSRKKVLGKLSPREFKRRLLNNQLNTRS